MGVDLYYIKYILSTLDDTALNIQSQGHSYGFWAPRKLITRGPPLRCQVTLTGWVDRKRQEELGGPCQTV